jgi:hypothetical protein
VQQGPGRARGTEQRIALDRVTDPGQVNPDLVAAAGDRADGEQRVPPVLPHGGKGGD